MKKHMCKEPVIVCDLKKGWLILLVSAVFISATGYSQHQGYRPVGDLGAFERQFAAESSKIASIESTFTQEKVLTALTEKITSTGKFWFKRSNKVRIEYLKPYTYTMIMNGDKMLFRDDQKENMVNVRSNKLFQQINQIMIDCVQGTVLESKDFNVKVFEDEKTYLLEMDPTTRSLREFFSTIVLKVDKKDFAANSIEMNERSGDRTTILFKDKKLNAQFSDAVFAF
ncbi:MAG TPA: outer membrane lipoprotein carrier protein LolA [Chryseolinea sp.]